MRKHTYKSPVLLLTYRKHEFLDEIFNVISRYSPPILYVASNQAANNEDRSAVNRVRAIIKTWKLPCSIEIIFQDHHKLINESIQDSIDQVLEVEKSVIVLEDDTVPSDSFFDYCNHMLTKYEHNNSVGSINGCNLGILEPDSAFFTPLAVFYWGWATWSRAWKESISLDIPWSSLGQLLPECSPTSNPELVSFLTQLDQRTTWDIKWCLRQAMRRQRCIIPKSNLVENKGFMNSGSYTRFASKRFSGIKATKYTSIHEEALPNHLATKRYENASLDLILEILESRGERETYFRGGGQNG